jgi:hypothetical protein
MHIRIQIVVVTDGGVEHVHEIANLARPNAMFETIGLTLEESKQALRALQEGVVQHQVKAYLEVQRSCPHCQKPRRVKDSAPAPFRTLFGAVQVPNPRWYHCNCRDQKKHTFRPLTALLPERTSPELLYLETKWASLASYGITSNLLHEVLPIDKKHSAVTVRNHLLRVGQRNEQGMGAEKANFLDYCQADVERQPTPNGPLSVGLDGGIVRARRGKSGEKTPNLFEVIAGKSILSFRRDGPEGAAPSSKCFALVKSVDKKPKRRLFDLLQSQGMQINQQVTFFSDGGDTVRQMQEYLNPDSEHILDWFHITMRITVLKQCARGLHKPVVAPERSLERRLESIKHYLWHGNSAAALDRLRDVDEDLECWDCNENGEKKPRPDSESAARMLKYVSELETYVANNATFIINYGERYRNGDRISTGFVESTINQVVSKRMVKKQQMQWTPRGAHLLLQVRTQVLNEDLDKTFRQWYPHFRLTNPSSAPLPMAA